IGAGVVGCSRPGPWKGFGSGNVPEGVLGAGVVGAGSVARGAVDGASSCGTLPGAEGGGTTPWPSADGAGTLLGAGTEGVCGGGPKGSSGVGIAATCCAAAWCRLQSAAARSRTVASAVRMYLERSGRRVVSVMLEPGEATRSARRPCPRDWKFRISRL